MTDKTPTPRVDALVVQVTLERPFPLGEQMPFEAVHADFARTLERELAAAAEREMMKAQQCTAERLRANAAEEELARQRVRYNDAVAERDEAIKQRDQYYAAFRECQDAARKKP